jgi:hypothetical protein
MLKDVDAQGIYDKALAFAQAAGFSLRGNCTNISHSMLDEAKKVDSSATIAVGWIEWEGKEYFKFSDVDFQSWISGPGLESYPFHCWIKFPKFDDLLDLTLTETVRWDAPERVDGYTYLRKKEDSKLGIIHKEYQSGDSILIELQALHGFKFYVVP